MLSQLFDEQIYPGFRCWPCRAARLHVGYGKTLRFDYPFAIFHCGTIAVKSPHFQFVSDY
jgi:hypothetical protein